MRADVVHVNRRQYYSLSAQGMKGVASSGSESMACSEGYQMNVGDPIFLLQEEGIIRQDLNNRGRIKWESGESASS